MPSFTPIDLSKLPFPNVIEPLDYEAILNEMVEDYLANFPNFQLSESDAVMKAFETCARFRLRDRQRVNEAEKQNFIAIASGSNLDNLVANLIVSRKNGESDDELRARAVLANEGFSVAGPRGAYYFHGLSAHADVADVGVSSPTPGQVQIVVLAKNGVPNAQIISAVTNALNDEDVRPITDEVVILPVQLVDFTIDATIYTHDGADPSLVVDYAKSRLNEYLSAARKVGVDIAISGIYSNLHVAGVQKVVLTHPNADIVISENQCGNCTAVNVIFGGTNG